MSKTKFAKCYGNSISMKIRRSDGKNVLLDFAKPALTRTPYEILRNNSNPRPLSQKKLEHSYSQCTWTSLRQLRNYGKDRNASH
jgi:hypothetical protein